MRHFTHLLLLGIFLVSSCIQETGRQEIPSEQDSVFYSGKTLSNVDYHHGQLPLARGIHNIQVMRASREHPGLQQRLRRVGRIAEFALLGRVEGNPRNVQCLGNMVAGDGTEVAFDKGGCAVHRPVEQQQNDSRHDQTLWRSFR